MSGQETRTVVQCDDQTCSRHTKGRCTAPEIHIRNQDSETAKIVPVANMTTDPICLTYTNPLLERALKGDR